MSRIAQLLNESVVTATIAVVDVVSTTEYETNVIIYGTDRTGNASSTPGEITPGGSETFIGIENRVPEVWPLLADWVMKTLTDADLDPLVNPNASSTIRKMYREGHTNRLFQLKTKGASADPQLPDGVTVGLKPLGNRGMEVSLSGPYFSKYKTTKRINDEKRFLKRGIQFVLDIVIPSIGETKLKALDALYQILASNELNWVEVELAESMLLINTKYEEMAYPEEVYVGPDTEEVTKLEDWIYDALQGVKFGMPPAKNPKTGKYDPEYAQEPLKTELKEKVALVKQLYADGKKKKWIYTEVEVEKVDKATNELVRVWVPVSMDVVDMQGHRSTFWVANQLEKAGATGQERTFTHQYVVDPTTDEGKLAIRHSIAPRASQAGTDRSKAAAETLNVTRGRKYMDEFKGQIDRIIQDGAQYGIPEDKIVAGIIAYICSYNFKIWTLDDFERLNVDAKRKVLGKLKDADYIDIHGLWESVMLPINSQERNALDLHEYKQLIDSIRKYLIENPDVYSHVLNLMGIDRSNAKLVLESYSLSAKPLNGRTMAKALAIMEAKTIVDGAKRLFNIVLASMDAKSVIYAEKLAPSDILNSEGHIVDDMLIESVAKSGVNLLEIYSRKDGKIRPELLARLT